MTNITNNNPQAAANLRKAVVDISKTKKRRELEHDSKIQQKIATLVEFSRFSQYQMNQARKVGKKVISEIQSQIEELRKLRKQLNIITQEKRNEIELSSSKDKQPVNIFGTSQLTAMIDNVSPRDFAEQRFGPDSAGGASDKETWALQSLGYLY